MWLLDTASLQLDEFFDSSTPQYAILSHTWGNDEVSWRDMQRDRDAAQSKAGFSKIAQFCKTAKARGFRYGWVDTCCIDKRSSAELSEAINSMYRYYRDAAECLVYLVDVPGVGGDPMALARQLEAFKSSRWFSRGWTLQELLAPRTRLFFARDWSQIEDKVGPGSDLIDVISDVTTIDQQVLRDRDLLLNLCIAKRMSWASMRQTTRSEDVAYSLMGLFNANMPVLYGEGAKNAFRRLQLEIIKTSFDQTIFAWRGDYESSGMLANAPSDFTDTPKLGLPNAFTLVPFSVTNVGLSIRLLVHCGEAEKGAKSNTILVALQSWFLVGESWKILAICLQQVPETKIVLNGKVCNVYRRIRCREWIPMSYEDFESSRSGSDLIILQDEHFDFVRMRNGIVWV